ncbi:bifunctional 3-(3-hydroxy-phenyl)propionate/3-hydroxycinnamic acid hydroxylase [Sphingomonas sp. GC_Shp_3]|uniref:bifunctional 3-(3-hydroxy-phenyl)propionate/3-hydroxycinnamic acid hydroxylase MhpA n=1 Tax=Sphingomonas sp. GC_Shp_3 TaxID=2937383 RepID=UPI00226ADB66
MQDFDIVIIGCGPVGGAAANLLGRAGLNVLVVEKQADPYPLPRAVHIDHEVMRIFQSAGVVDGFEPLARDTQGHLHIGADGGVLRYLGTAGQARRFGWSNDYFFYQPELEALLRERLAAMPNVTFWTGASAIGLNQDADGVTIALERADGGVQVRAGHVIACDGASSPTRAMLGVSLVDLGFEEPWLVVDVEMDGPVTFPPYAGLPIGADLQQLSVMMCDPRRPTTIVPGRGNHRRWEFMLLPGEQDEAMRAPERVAALIAPWVGDLPHTVVRAATYRFHGLVADRWQVGRVFLAGDAAHQTPPFFGQGMCHGMRDVASLAWKLALVHRDLAGAPLLDGYQGEREPQVRAVISAAIEAGKYICELDPFAAAARDRIIREREATRTVHTAADLINPITGLVLAASTGAGERFIQPRLTDAEGLSYLLDDVTGAGLRLFVAGDPVLDAASADAFKRLGGGVVSIEALQSDTLAAWLAAHDAVAVLVRPDFYVFGTARTAAEVGPLLDAFLRGVGAPVIESVAA